jgi:hypothetical protein
MRGLAPIAIAGLLGASSCKEQPAAPKAPEARGAPSASSATPASSVRVRSVPADDAGFHRVAELPYPIALTPLGSDALLVAGETWNQILLSIEKNQLRFRRELNDIGEPPESRPFVWTVGGSWPDEAWLALSVSSDAGPSSSNVYRWSGSSWVKKHEHASGIVSLAAWRGSLAMQGSFLSVPAMVGQQLHELSSSGVKKLNSTLCSSSGASPLAPLRVQDGALSLFGYECGPHAGPPESGMALVVETWSASGIKSKQRVPLPREVALIDRMVADRDGWAAVLPAQGQEPRRLARFAAGRWQTLAVLPAEFSVLAEPGSFELWGVVGSQLRQWQGHDWSVMELPALPAEAQWISVWQRAPGDVWLVARSDAQSWLFNSADGKSVAPLPSEAERNALGEAVSREREPGDCPEPFADVLVLRPHQRGEDFAVTLSPEKARRLLKAALARSPRFQHLQFVRHGCYGEDCIGAKVNDREEAEALRSELVSGTRLEPAIEKFARGDVRCYAPPTSQPFTVSP